MIDILTQYLVINTIALIFLTLRLITKETCNLQRGEVIIMIIFFPATLVLGVLGAILSTWDRISETKLIKWFKEEI